MKIGYTPSEFYSLYRGLSREIFDYFDYDLPRPKFSTTQNQWEGELGSTSFNSPNQEWATEVDFHRGYFPYLYEDEAIGLILHELAHVVAGFRSAHWWQWQKTVQEIGGHDQEVLIIRRWKHLPEPLRPHPLGVLTFGVYYADYA